MSLNSFDKKKDKTLKENYSEVIENKTKITIPEKPYQGKEKKKSVTFSITDSQLNKLEEEAKNRQFKNKSEFLAFIIDNL